MLDFYRSMTEYIQLEMRLLYSALHPLSIAKSANKNKPKTVKKFKIQTT